MPLEVCILFGLGAGLTVPLGLRVALVVPVTLEIDLGVLGLAVPLRLVGHLNLLFVERPIRAWYLLDG